MAKKAPIKEDQEDVLGELIMQISNNMSSLSEQLNKANNVAAAAKRARLLTSTLTKQFKEFRAVSVAHFKK